MSMFCSGSMHRHASIHSEAPVTADHSQIRNVVIDHYGSRARRAAGEDMIPVEAVGGDESCCVPEPMTDAERTLIRGLYSHDEVAGLPQAALEAAAGCGNPMAIAELRAGEVVLDLGSGGGIDCFLAAKQVGPAGRVIGVDVTPDMVELARKNAADVGATNVEFKLGEIEALPLENASVDAVISNCVINLSTEKDAVFAEVARVLKSGGRFRVSDIVWTKDRPDDAATAEDWAGCIAGALPLQAFLDGLTHAGLSHARADSVRFLDEERGLASALISAEKPSS
jgi:SAM-dependent methyltransferase